MTKGLHRAPDEPRSRRSVTVVVPALNEARGLEGAVDIILAALARRGTAYEVIIIDDGSTDGTGMLADGLAARHPRVQALHHARPCGLGGTVREGYARARMEHVLWVDGKGATTPEALDAILARCGEADLVVPYPVNQHERLWFRRAISRAFVGLLNGIFRIGLSYYTMPVLCKTSLARAVRLDTRSHALQAEMLIKLIKAGCSYVTVPVRDNYAFAWNHTKAFRWANVSGVAAFLARTLWAVYGPGGRERLRAAVKGAGGGKKQP